MCLPLVSKERFRGFRVWGGQGLGVYTDYIGGIEGLYRDYVERYIRMEKNMKLVSRAYRLWGMKGWTTKRKRLHSREFRPQNTIILIIGTPKRYPQF